jgi:hypothetical protein
MTRIHSPSRTAVTGAIALLALAVGTAVANHGGDTDHLPPTSKNMALVSKLEPLSRGPVGADQIGDVSVHKGFAYLQSGANCAAGKGGFYVVDIRDPASPKEVAFAPAAPNTRHGEGAHAIAVSTPSFSGDLLAVNDEACPGGGGSGGFDLYDVSNPSSPQLLVEGFGDLGGEGTLTGGAAKAHDARSVFIWDAGAKAYAAAVDNEELHDLDIFDITDPAEPQPVREYNLRSATPAWQEEPNGNDAVGNDVVVKGIGSSWMLLASYGDAGFVQLDVTDPAAAKYVGDTDYGTSDPLTGFDPPEGNAHYAEFTHDDRYLVTADEDLAPYRVEEIDVEGEGRFPAEVVGGGAAPNVLADGRLDGPMAYGGYACPDNSPSGDTPKPVPNALSTFPVVELGQERILVVQRGPDGDPNEDYDGDGDTTDADDACFPGQKADVAESAGWDAILIVNRHLDGGAAADEVHCGTGGFTQTIVVLCTTHEAGHAIFDDPASYERPYDDEIELAPVGTTSPHELDATGVFDGWGYMGLYGTALDGAGKLPLLDAYAIPEAMNPDYAQGFGELTIHEQAADPTEPLSYSSYRSAGMRVFSFESGKITPQGAFVDQPGNDMWGVEQFTTANGERLIAGSDRDFGLYVLRYTGPLAPRPPSCVDAAVAVPANGSVRVPLACSDPNGNPLTRRIVSAPAAGSLGLVDQASGTVTYFNTGAAGGSDSFSFEASDGAATSAAATIAISVGQAPPGASQPGTSQPGTPSPGKPPLGGRCAGKAATEVGTGGRDVLGGTAQRDVILALGGNDVVRGLGGGDVICGGGGKDDLRGGGGKDLLLGQGGADVLRGGPGADALRGGGGKDELLGGPGKDAQTP